MWLKQVIFLYFENWEFARLMIFEMTGTWMWTSTVVIVSPAAGNQDLWDLSGGDWWHCLIPNTSLIVIRTMRGQMYIYWYTVIQLKIPIENLSFPWTMKIQKILSAGRLVNVPALKLYRYISVTINISLQYSLSVHTASSRS